MKTSSQDISKILKHVVLVMLILLSASADMLCQQVSVEARKVVSQMNTQDETEDDATNSDNDVFVKAQTTKATVPASLQVDLVRIAHEVEVVVYESVLIEEPVQMLVHPTLLDYYQRLFSYYIVANAP
ncbi:hypothetical protein V6R21_12810 [Limibacter armeniacum]|uniref:hypothetical protein n=1 Tax=Limibacter armeniacum TaxID=466084 RepID=UPI002FE6A98D